MNDTILNQRKKSILGLLQEKGAMSRPEIEKILGTTFPQHISRITVIRDLNALIDLGLIITEGSARATVYAAAQANPLLSYIDLTDYFSGSERERNAKSSFDEGVFSRLNQIFDKDEVKVWEESSISFKKRKKELDQTIYKREFERFMIELSWKSSQIEGNTYDLLETEALLIHKVEARGHTKMEAIMIINHKNAFEYILNNKNSFKKLTSKTVIDLHNILVKDLSISTGIRHNPVRITGAAYIPPHDEVSIKKLLSKIIATINKTDYPPEKALIAVSMISYLQTFADGNKRTARMLSNAILLAYDYFPLSYRNVEVTEYQKAMILFYEQNNLSNFKRIFMEQLDYAVNNYFLT